MTRVFVILLLVPLAGCTHLLSLLGGTEQVPVTRVECLPAKLYVDHSTDQVEQKAAQEMVSASNNPTTKFPNTLTIVKEWGQFRAGEQACLKAMDKNQPGH